MFKICTKKDCPFKGAEQPIESFHKDRTSSSGFSSWCKTCTKTKYWNSINNPTVKKIIPPPGTKICSNIDCPFGGTPQLLESFSKNCTSSDELTSRCKTCISSGRKMKREYTRLEKLKPQKETIITPIGMKICSGINCKFKNHPQSLDNFLEDQRTLDKKNILCKSCYDLGREEFINKRKHVVSEGMKICMKNGCPFNGAEQPKSEFSIVNRNSDGLSAWCMTCQRAYRSEKSELISERRKKLYKNRYNNDINYRIRIILSGAIKYSLIKCNGKEGHTWENLVGFNVTELRERIESLFQEGMTWDNYGEWHIDHIRPVSSFNITSYDCEDFEKCWALENLQPLWAKDNLRKGNQISEEWNNI